MTVAFLFATTHSSLGRAQSTAPVAPGASSVTSEDKPKASAEPRWYERLHIRGYTQLRYNNLVETNHALKSEQADKSVGGDPSVFLRRARLLVYGDVFPSVSVYFQTDFASAFDDGLNFGQVRDWYTDIFLDDRKMFRIRAGQQKVPYGFELMQSSQNRLPFDRSDALNSAFVNERDIGAFLFFETEWARKKFRSLVDSGLKGSGDYGIAAVGVTNGQPLNTREKNANKHLFARLTYPFEIGSQTVEVGGGGYTGLFVPNKSEGVEGERQIRDVRVHGTFVLYPRPIGFQAEYNVGVGPERDGDKVVEKPLDGGYVMGMVRVKTDAGNFTPYVRAHRYDGGKKFFENAPRHEVREVNAGIEWQPNKWLELTAEFMKSERIVDGKAQDGELVRAQLQVNY